MKKLFVLQRAPLKNEKATHMLKKISANLISVTGLASRTYKELYEFNNN